MTLTQIAPNLYQIQRVANIFLLVSTDGILVIDTGIPGASKQILQAAEQLGGKITHILITHADIDHAGSLGGLVKRTGAQTYAGESAAQYIQQRTSPPHVPAFMAFFGGIIQKLFQQAAPITHLLKDGEVLPLAGGMRVVAAPGHSPDNFNFFWEKERVLFAPDLLNTMNGALALSPKMITYDMDMTRKSARKVLALSPRLICVGHGAAVDVEKSPEQLEGLMKQL